MTKPPPPDKLPGAIKYRPPQGKPEDRPLERLHQEFENHESAKSGDAPANGRASPRPQK